MATIPTILLLTAAVLAVKAELQKRRDAIAERNRTFFQTRNRFVFRSGY